MLGLVFSNGDDESVLVHPHTPAVSSHDLGQTYAGQLAGPGLWPRKKKTLLAHTETEPVTLFSLARCPDHLSYTVSEEV